jgi:murein DD-endopeptidase MepM/ murein hydrolase activator NlpD
VPRRTSRSPVPRVVGVARVVRVVRDALLTLSVLGALVVAVPPAPASGATPPSTGGPLQVAPSAVTLPPADGMARVRYASPVPVVEVLRAFDPGPSPFGPGHRGVDLAAPVGGTVAAAAAGVVRHAGPVAGTVWVSIDHPDGLTTSYGPLADLGVRRGEPVAGGTPLGALAPGGHGNLAADRGLHWGARRGETYLDPLSLLEGGVWRPSLVGAGGWRGTQHAVEPYAPWEGSRWQGIGVAASPTARRPGYAVPPNANHLVLVRGLGSSSDSLPFDPADLGYDPRSVTAHSYAGVLPAAAGGRPGPGISSGPDGSSGDPADPWRDQRPYGPADTWRGVEAASAHLRDQLRARWAAEPGRAVDLVGYSMGGVVVMHYLTHHHDPYDPSLPPIGHVATIAAPLQGSDVAALGTGIRDHRGLSRAVGALRDRGVLDELPPLRSAALEDLAPGSRVLQELADGWQNALEADAAGALAMGTRVLTVGGSRDQVVAARRSLLPPGSTTRAGGDAPVGDTSVAGPPVADVPGHFHRVLPGGHGSVLETEALREVLWRFLAGQEVVDSPGHLANLVSREQGDALGFAGGFLRLHDGLTGP